MKNYVFGDTGGHYQQLRKAMLKIGMDDNFKIPEDVHIVHLGDLVHKGPDTLSTIRLVDNIMRANPGQWTQIIGNHEAQYLGGQEFWVENIDEEVVQTLHTWYEQGLMKFTHAITGDVLHTTIMDYVIEDPIVFSHAGISREFFDEYLTNVTVDEFDEVIKNLPVNKVYRPGLMLGEIANKMIGPVWAHGVTEVWKPWFGNAVFNQIVGHIAPYSWGFDQWYPGTDQNFRKVSTLHETEHFTIAHMSNNKFDNTVMGFMDPGYGKRAYGKVQPYVIID